MRFSALGQQMHVDQQRAAADDLHELGVPRRAPASTSEESRWTRWAGTAHEVGRPAMAPVDEADDGRARKKPARRRGGGLHGGNERGSRRAR